MAIFIAATVPVDKPGDVNHLLEAAKTVGEPAADDEKKQEQQPKDNGSGSYERFMMTFGSPRRWGSH